MTANFSLEVQLVYGRDSVTATLTLSSSYYCCSSEIKLEPVYEGKYTTSTKNGKLWPTTTVSTLCSNKQTPALKSRPNWYMLRVKECNRQQNGAFICDYILVAKQHIQFVERAPRATSSPPGQTSMPVIKPTAGTATNVSFN